MKVTVAILLLLSSLCITLGEDQTTPIVLWHGMGDSCCFSFSLGAFKERLETTFPGVYVLSIRIGNNEIEDVENGYFMHPNQQIEEACNIISADPKLADGFNAIGFSQGGQFLRGLVQRCGNAKVKSLITLGGQHQGVYGIPHCLQLSETICNFIRNLLNNAAYEGWVQEALAQATYWHDPLDEALYRNASTFIGEINNEQIINQTYIERIQALEHFVMVKFENDSMVEPVDSEWFGFYKPGQAEDVQTLEESTLFTDDRLGLQKLSDESKLHFLQVEGDHLRFSWEWFVENVVPFLQN